MTPEDFIAQIGPAAKTAMQQTKIPASFTVAQAALESSWGTKAPGFNLFGIKADKSWHGKAVNVPTHEDINGRHVPIMAEFRAYSSWLESILDHSQFLIGNKRYAAAFQTTDGIKFAQAVAAAGYATDPEYGDKLASIIRYHNLLELDV